MFGDGGVPNQEHFHQFMASQRTFPLPLPLPLPFSFPPSDSIYTSPTTHHLLHHQISAPPLVHHQDTAPVTGTAQNHDHLIITPLQPKVHLHGGPTHMDNSSFSENQRNLQRRHHRPWTSEEVLALLRIRSGFQNWLNDFTWVHISRKMEEIGFKRSADECRQRFEEEENKYLSSNNDDSSFSDNYNKNSNFRVLCEFNELYDRPDEHDEGCNDLLHQIHKHAVAVTVGDDSKKKTMLIKGPGIQEDDKICRNREKRGISREQEEDLGKICEDKTTPKEENDEISSSSSCLRRHHKRRKKEKFEVLKGFCEEIVKKMLDQQEEIHRKLIEEMLKRDEENATREEAWKKQELERINNELEIRAQEQLMVSERSASIISFINKLTSLDPTGDRLHLHRRQQQLHNYSNTPSSSSSVLAQNPSPVNNASTHDQTPNPTQNPNSPNSSSKAPSSLKSNFSTPQKSQILEPCTSISALKLHSHFPKHSNGNELCQDLGRRWPKDEVLALINIRCKIYNNGGDQNHPNNDQNKEVSATKAPLWERVSHGMSVLGYKRSAKRCKEKWENINKYFRKTKDSNKKRSVDSRTCPYFHMLSSLYSQGKLPASDSPETRPPSGSSIDSTVLASSSVLDAEKDIEMPTVEDLGFEI